MSSALFFSASLPSNNTPQSFTNKPNPSSSNANISSNPLKTLPKPHNSTKFFPPKTNNNIVPNPISDTDVDKAIKMPTAPWMTTPILLPSNKVPPFSKTINKHTPFDKLDRSLTDKVRGRRGRQAMRDIIKSVTKLQQLSIPEHPRVPPEKSEKFEFGFGLKLELERVGEEEVEEVRVPWGMSERGWFRRMKKEKVVTAAELSLPALVIERLRSDAKKITQWVKVNKVGMSQAVVDEVKMTWRNKELVMLKFELPLCRNMDRALEIVETQTGGLVVWRKKDTLVVYRGCKYESSKDFLRLPSNRASTEVTSSSSVSHFKVEEDSAGLSHKEFDGITGEMHNSVENSFRISAAEKFSLEPVTGTLYEREADRLLDGLGPRFVNWWWRKPLPVDADMLPKLVPGFMTPFRLCPPNLRPTISDDELTYLRKTARSLPTHFALGRNTKLQGLASAVIKLWEKSLIVKIAVKWGIPNTNNEQMAWELKASYVKSNKDS
ncbi:hypothetical protein GIB67_037495 [Kingdonia uniflora]|uniref:CRM domain-containing protein n=1 Tax=Kingdonia uniflora TaxID=39325 RepID=A0A7J7KXB0_9MAGN|nr:hypothetical protein GIB67_037495 [Kingdonia uniflora]